MSCPNTNSSFTDSELNAIYTGGLLNRLSNPQRDTNGILQSSSLNAWFNTLVSSNVIPTLPTQDDFKAAASAATNTNSQNNVVQAYITAENKFSADLRSEYCYYEARYKHALRTLISKLATQYSTSGTQNTQVTTEVNTYLTICETLNIRLNDLILLSNAVARNRLETSRNKTSEANQINNELQTRAASLQEQARILKDKSSTADLYKRMIEYTEEKNRANRNLLSLYSFLNIVALGMLVYVYRAA